MPGSTDQARFAALVIATSLFSSAPAQPVSHDFNADGSEDFPVSLTGFESTDPVTGAARIWSGASKTVLDTFVAAGTNTLFGWSVGSAGDLNDDGFNDLIVGEPLWGQGGSLVGRFHVFSGDDASPLLVVEGPYLETALGRYVAGVADWNGDGTPDIAASGWDIADLDSDGIGDDPIGIVYIFSGADGSILAEISDPAATAMFGYAVFGLGDITGDGFADIAIVDRHARATPQSVASGQVYLFTGRATPGVLTVTDAHRVLSNTDPAVRGYAAQVDVMHPDVWLSEPTLQIISLTTTDAEGGPNHAETRIDLVQTDGTGVGAKGVRSSLVLAGDINLDGKVNALDLQASISQLGTNPQAMGVMPIADMNNDQVVDADDVALLLQGYGSSTDIYEGLWDGSRLLAVVGGSAGFGSTAGANLSGVSHLEGGRRPMDDCLRGEIPPTQGPGLVPMLLRLDARQNCSSCPPYSTHPGCYECESDKGVTGGSVTASPDQPLIGQSVTFSVSGVSETPGTLKCQDISGCGDDGKTEPTPLGDPSYIWQVMTKGPNGWPEELDPNEDSTSGWPGGPSITVAGGAACEEKKAICWAIPSAPCVPDEDPWTRVGEAEVKFAEFKLSWECVADTPTKHRTEVGIGEEIDISVVGPGAGTPVWEVNGENKGEHASPYRVEAQESAGTLVVKASINGCSRALNFSVIEPRKRNYTVCPDAVEHDFGKKDIHVYYKMDLDPDTVSFYNVAVQEGAASAEGLTGDYLVQPAPAHPLGPWRAVREDNTIIARDHAYADLSALHMYEGSFYWNIPLIYAVTGGATIHTSTSSSEKQIFVMTVDCVSVEKGGFESPNGCRQGPSLVGDFTGCNVHGE